MLDNITGFQKTYLWIIILLTLIAVLIDRNIFTGLGIFFVISVFSIEVWNNAGEKQQLIERVKELECSSNLNSASKEENNDMSQM